ncbi:hypothetical protein, partial [Streptomyces celluloflavus]|uniref:hypothetical protein n=1 Tax=Streptomyces celluloflavus TaxID=58344 RepID=UPI003695A045
CPVAPAAYPTPHTSRHAQQPGDRLDGFIRLSVRFPGPAQRGSRPPLPGSAQCDRDVAVSGVLFQLLDDFTAEREAIQGDQATSRGSGNRT